MSFDLLPEKLRNIVGNGELPGQSGGTRKIIGASTTNNLLTIQGIMESNKPEKTLEIGMAYGISSLLFALKHQQLNSTPLNQHYLIDPFQKTNFDSCALLLLQNMGLENYINFSESYSSIQLPRWVEENLKFDLIYIDGSHLFEDVFVDYYYCSTLLNENGIVLFDDCRDPHIFKVIKFIKKNMGRFFAEIDLNQYVKRRGSNLLKFKVARKLNEIQLRGFRKLGSNNIRRWDSKFGNF